MKITSMLLTIIFSIHAASGNAQGITGSISGPGGSGVVTVDDLGQIHVTKTFTSIDYLDLNITVAPGAVADQHFPESIFNSSGLSWTDFHFKLITPAPLFSFIEAFPHSPFANVGGDLLSIDLTGGVVQSGGTFSPSLGVHIVDPNRLGYTYTIRQTPSVPEPSTWLLMLSGVTLTGATLRRRGAFVPAM